MIKKLLLEKNLFLAISNFCLAFVFIFLNGPYADIASFFFFINFVFNMSFSTSNKQQEKNNSSHS